MNAVTLPGTDLAVSRVCLGTGGLGTALTRDGSFALLDAFADAGGNFIDTAHVYGNWVPGDRHQSEKTIGPWLKSTGQRDRFIVATKGGHPELATPHISRLSPEEITTDLSESLDLLGIDTIDLYWLHRDDPARPVGEMLEVLNQHVEAGLIRSFGCSNWRPERIREAHNYAAMHALRPFVASQVFWSLAVPNPGAMPADCPPMDAEAAALYATSGMSVLAYSSQARGFFTKASTGGVQSLKEGVRRAYENAETLARLTRAEELARRLGTSVTAVVLAYIMSQPFVGVPIVGSHTPEQLRDSLSGADLTLPPDLLHYLTGDVTV